MRRIAMLMGLSPVALHNAIVKKRNGLSDKNFIALCRVLNIMVQYWPHGIEIIDLELMSNEGITQKRITKYNINGLEAAFYTVNGAKMEDKDFRLSEYEFELEEYIIENAGSAILVKLLSNEEKCRINAYCTGTAYSNKSLIEKIRYCHNSHFRIAEESIILRAAVRTNLRKNIGEYTTELKKAQFPDIFCWDIANCENIPF